VKTLALNGAKETWVAATHGVFSGQAPVLIQEARIKTLLVTDTIESSSSEGEILSVAPLIANYIQRILK
jgi:ribose-phosphate pyrophosphokinase